MLAQYPALHTLKMFSIKKIVLNFYSHITHLNHTLVNLTISKTYNFEAIKFFRSQNTRNCFSKQKVCNLDQFVFGVKKLHQTIGNTFMS